jgi:hypothetical protein
MRDEEKREEKGEYTTEVTHHQQRDRHDGAPPPNTTTGHSEPAPGLCETSHKGSDDDTSSYDGGWLDPELAPRLQYQPPSPIPIAQYLPPSPDNGAYDATGEYVDHVVMTEGDAFDANGEPDHSAMIERLALEPTALGDASGNWAEEVDSSQGLIPQGEYMLANYSPTPSPPSPAPQPQPPLPITIYLPPPIDYVPPPTRHRPPCTRNTSRRPPYRPHTCPQRVRYPPRENRTGHVTATRREGFRAATRVEHNGTPRYVAPALRGNNRTPYRSHQSNPRHSGDWRDQPPHKDLPTRGRKGSDSPNWRAPSPNRPASFRSDSPPPQSPPTPPISPLFPNIPSMPPPKSHWISTHLRSRLPHQDHFRGSSEHCPHC